MPRYLVAIPCTLTVTVEVDAHSSEEAKKKALDANLAADIRPASKEAQDMSPEAFDFMMCDDFTMYDVTTKGSICNEEQNETESKEIDDGA